MKDIIHQSSALPTPPYRAAEATCRKQWLRFSPAGLWKALLLLFVLCIELSVFGQNIQVTGNVHDEAGEPIIGASVIVVGATTGVATDFDGNFILNNVPANGKLKVTYIGYNPAEVNIKGQTNIDITLVEDSQVLDEVVVVGYGTVKKSDLTGSVSSVTTEKLNAKGAPSILENLQGTTPGVNITKSTGRANGGINVEIRGKSSINSSTSPLYVVDGVMCDDIDFLNPQDIERIDVLKDASSTAIYGSRATAGVIMVTTKSGSNVNKDTKASITYDGYYGVTKAARMPDFMDGQEYYYYRISKFIEPVWSTANLTPQTSYWMKPASSGLGQALLQKEINNYQSEYVLKELLANNQTYDWPGLVTKDGHQQNHYVAISGASETANYHFGLGYNDEDGMYAGDKQTTISFKGSVDARVNKVISGGFNFNMAYIRNGYASDDAIAQAYRVNPFMQPYKEDGTIQHFPGNKNTFGTDDHQFSDFINPLDRMRNESQKRKTYRLLGNVYLQFDIIKGLFLKTTFSPTYTNYRNGQFTGYINPETGKTYTDQDAANTAVIKNQTSLGWTWDNMVNFNRTFNRDHSVGFMGLVSLMRVKTEGSQINGVNVIENTDWWNIGSGDATQTTASSSFSTQSMLSYALRLNYGFKDRYLLTATMRWDGSSKFADGYRWGSFPSAAFAWRISEESFLRKEWLNNLKLRVSYGVTGNNKGVDNYATIVGIGGPIYYPFGTNGYLQGFYPNGIVDTSLAWEKSHEFNVGLDFGFLQNRINGSIDWYQKNSNDLLYEVELPLEAGGVKMDTNIGKVQNRGIEVSLTTVNIDTRDWQWSTTFTFAHNKNKVKQINGVGDKYLNGSNATGNLFIGYPVNNVYGYDWVGVVTDRDMVVPDNAIAAEKGLVPGTVMKEYDYYNTCYGLIEGQPVIDDVNGDGVFDENDMKIWSSDPDWTGSFTSNLNYRLPKNGGDLDFSFSLYAKQGYTVSSSFLGGDYYDLHDRGRGKMMMDYYIPAGTLIDADGIRPDGTFINPVYQTETHYGKYPFPNAGTGDGIGAAEAYYQGNQGGRRFCDASFVKVKNITLGYSFSKNLLKHIACKNLRVYFTVTNPFVWTKYEGFDPEWASAAGKNDGPSTITYQVGASIKF